MVPQEIRDKYKTVWEIPMRELIDMSADRGAYICQSQSLNIHLMNANFGKMTSMHFYAWKKGLKTGMYYLRTKAATDAIKFTVTKEQNAQPKAMSVKETDKNKQAIQCSLDDPEGCEMCGS